MSAPEHIAGASTGEAAIHFVLWRAEPGGMENYAAAYIRHFAPSRRTHLFSLRPGLNTLTGGADNYAEGAIANHRMCWAWFRYCRQHRRDRFHLLNSGPVILLITLLAGVRRPVYHIHGTLFWKGTPDRWALRALWWATLPFRPVFVANSQYSADMFRQTAAPVRPVVIHNGFDTPLLLAGRRRRTRLARMACVGRMAPGKNAELAVHAFNAIAARLPDLELHFAGTGPQEGAVRDEALGSPFRRRIFFHGWVKDMPAFYAAQDLVLFPSSHESFGNVLVEALINGLPVLASDLPVFEEIHGDRATFSLGSPAQEGPFIRNFVSAVERFDELAEKSFAASDQFALRFGMEEHLKAIERIHTSAGLRRATHGTT